MSSFYVRGKKLYICGVPVISKSSDLIELYEIVVFFKFLCEANFNTLQIDSVIYGFDRDTGRDFCKLLIPTYKLLDKYKKSVIDECAFNAFNYYSISSSEIMEGHAGLAITDYLDTGRIMRRIPSCDIEEKAYEVFSKMEPLLKQALAEALS